MPAETIGMVGLGLLGGALAERLLGAGFSVFGWDLDPARLEHLAALGGRPAESLNDVAVGTRRIVLSLPDSDVVREVVEPLVARMAKGTTIIDTTTGDPSATAQMGAKLRTSGIDYLDATVAGSSAQARAGEVLAMVGGERAAFDACGDLLDTFASRAFYVGPSGSGARMKLVVNLVLGLQRAVLAEGLAFAKASGLDPALALEVLAAGPTAAKVIETKGQKMLTGDFTPQARLAQHAKDVRLILATGADHHAQLPLSQLHRELLEQLIADGAGELDNSAVIKAFE